MPENGEIRVVAVERINWRFSLGEEMQKSVTGNKGRQRLLHQGRHDRSVQVLIQTQYEL